MSEYTISLNQERCIACRACEVHCQTKQGEEQMKLGRFYTVTEYGKGEQPAASHIFLPCLHCENPWCVHACPTYALYRDTENGMVFLDEELCYGCQACIAACPWEVPQKSEETGEVVKCDYCIDLIEKGMDPACVKGCPTKALNFVSATQGVKDQRIAYTKQALLKSKARS